MVVITRYYVKKDITVELASVGIGKTYKNKTGIVDSRCQEALGWLADGFCDELFGMSVEVEMRKIASDNDQNISSHELSKAWWGNGTDPMVKMWRDVMPHSVDANTIDVMAKKIAGTGVQYRAKASIKPNETLTKVKPQLIQHFGQRIRRTTAAITSLVYASDVLTQRSTKRASQDTIEDRVEKGVQKYIGDGIASNKFSPNAEPVIFVGWRLDLGLRYRGVLHLSSSVNR